MLPMIAISVLANFIIGTLIGVSGIAGFLLPLVYVSVLGIELRTALAISFLSFLLGGIFGTISYKKIGNLDLSFSKFLNLGSIFGAILGVYLNTLIPVVFAKILLYIVVLLSGLSILLKKKETKTSLANNILEKKYFIVLIGFFTALICSMTGAGGPILVVPILTLIGVNIKTAVGVALLNQIIIALPSSIGYIANGNLEGLGLFIIFSLLFHVLGILFGARITEKINISTLKNFISILSISVSMYMLITTLI